MTHTVAPFGVFSAEALSLLEKLRGQADNFGIDWTVTVTVIPSMIEVALM